MFVSLVIYEIEFLLFVFFFEGSHEILDSMTKNPRGRAEWNLKCKYNEKFG